MPKGSEGTPEALQVPGDTGMGEASLLRDPETSFSTAVKTGTPGPGRTTPAWTHSRERESGSEAVLPVTSKVTFLHEADSLPSLLGKLSPSFTPGSHSAGPAAGQTSLHSCLQIPAKTPTVLRLLELG